MHDLIRFDWIVRACRRGKLAQDVGGSRSAGGRYSPHCRCVKGPACSPVCLPPCSATFLSPCLPACLPALLPALLAVCSSLFLFFSLPGLSECFLISFFWHTCIFLRSCMCLACVDWTGLDWTGRSSVVPLGARPDPGHGGGRHLVHAPLRPGAHGRQGQGAARPGGGARHGHWGRLPPHVHVQR
jgi:hypothetical protein